MSGKVSHRKKRRDDLESRKTDESGGILGIRARVWGKKKSVRQVGGTRRENSILGNKRRDINSTLDERTDTTREV